MGVVFGAVFRAVFRAVFGAVFRAVFGAVFRAVFGAVFGVPAVGADGLCESIAGSSHSTAPCKDSIHTFFSEMLRCVKGVDQYSRPVSFFDGADFGIAEMAMESCAE
jgi:hypothetical protein